MKIQIDLSLSPFEASDPKNIEKAVLEHLKAEIKDVNAIVPVLRSIDGRSKEARVIYRVIVYSEDDFPPAPPLFNYNTFVSRKKVIIVGSGPAGLFAALRLIELGIKPIILERGKDVRGRRKDLKAIQQDGVVNGDSNYCFGEGGAGTFSDGKLYTRATKRGNVNRIYHALIKHGADPDILIDSHPHIGSNKLPELVTKIRETITNCNGDFRFDSKVTDLILSKSLDANGMRKILGVVVNGVDEVFADAVILATGHSARDIFYMLDKNGVALESKPFAMGVRVEHPQELIDEARFRYKKRDPLLPPASYEVACEIDKRGVFSFCMCPGGVIIPASTSPGELVLNGMSVSRRDSKFANAGLVVSITDHDLLPFAKFGAFAGLEYQKSVELAAFNAGGGITQAAGAQRVIDFVNKKASSTLPASSYIPGVVTSPLHDVLPHAISDRLRKALPVFATKIRGFMTNEAIVLAAETRTSSPIRIIRDKETFMTPNVTGLFPAGEGAGFAGGIISAAIDGDNCALAIGKLFEEL